MNSPFARFVTLTAIQLGIARSILAADTNAVIPYDTMAQICEIAAGIDQTKLVVCPMVTSKEKAVHPADILLTIQSRASGDIPVKLGDDGQILNFPHEKKLSRENPSIRSNQPKGTLSLVVNFRIPLPEELAFRYARLGDGVAEANKAIKSQAGMLSFLAPKAEGVIFFFPKTSVGKARVEIISTTGRQEYSADEHGQVKLKLEKPLLAKNPEVKMSEKPQVVVPDME